MELLRCTQLKGSWYIIAETAVGPAAQAFTRQRGGITYELSQYATTLNGDICMQNKTLSIGSGYHALRTCLQFNRLQSLISKLIMITSFHPTQVPMLHCFST